MPILFTFLSGCFGVVTGRVCGRDVAWYHCPRLIWLFDPSSAAGAVAVAGRPALAAAAHLQGWARHLTEALSLWQDWTWSSSAEKDPQQLPEVWWTC